jgi:hypothetical protein
MNWCPTGDMIGDFMTKPLQGALFKTFRDQIMGVIPAKDPGPGKFVKSLASTNGRKAKRDHRSVLEQEAPKERRVRTRNKKTKEICTGNARNQH